MKGKYLTTTAKQPHPYEFYHDELGYNYRMPNLNAALACAQLEQLDTILLNKRELASMYSNFFLEKGIKFRNALNTILIILRDLLLMKNNNYKNISFIFLEKDYQKILEKFPEQKILELSKQILDYKRIIKYNISEKLILENICFENYKNE